MRSSVALSLLLLLSIFSPFIVARSPFRSSRAQSESFDTVNPTPVLTNTPPTPSATSTPTPFPPVPSSALFALSTDWALRYVAPNYLLTFNSSVDGVVIRKSWDESAVSQKLTAQLTHKEAERQQKKLDRYMEKLEKRMAYQQQLNNASQSDDHKESSHHHGEHKKDKKSYRELSSFYLRHAQCRACVQSNFDLISSASRVSLPSYQPNAVMKFCTFQTPLLPHERPPSVENPQPLQDWEGVCVPAASDCPATTVDLNILSTSTCANDVAVTKQSCALCVLDGYEWRTHKRAVKGGDNYEGVCASSSMAHSQVHGAVAISALDECPSVVASARAEQKMQQVKGGFFLFFSFAALLCICLGLRRCCMARKARVAARAALAQSGVSLPIAEPVHVISASASQPSSSSYPARAVQAQERAREVHHQAVAMQEPLLVSSGLNPPFYPSIHNPPPYGYRV